MAKKNKEKIDTNQESGQVVDLEEEKDNSKKKRRIKIKVFMYLVLLALIGSFIGAYAFNWFSIRQRILDVLIVGDEQYIMKMIDVDNEKEKAKGEQSLAQDAKAAYERQLKSLEGREQEIASKEQQIDERLKAVIVTTANGGDSRNNLIALFEGMDAKSAATTLQSMNDVDAVASILGSMKKKPAAAIMEAFDTEFAAIVAARMLL